MNNKHMYSTANLSDIELKEQGNRLFTTRKYEDAINCYSKAIIKNPSIATYFTNRALCHLKLKKWDATCQDCRRALDIDPQLVKGHFFLGQSLLEMGLFEEAIKHLQRACDLAKEQRRNFGDDIASQLRVARKKRFQKQEEKRMHQEIELQSYLNRLIMEDTENRIRSLKLRIISSSVNNEMIPGVTETDIITSSSKSSSIDSINDDLVTNSQTTTSLNEANVSEIIQEINQLENDRDNRVCEVNDLFSKIDDQRRKRDVPDYLCGKISFEILSEPVITPSGITYERKDIEEHLQRVGHFDPVTRVKLTQDQLIPNFSMKEVVDAFVQENEWALDY